MNDRIPRRSLLSTACAAAGLGTVSALGAAPAVAAAHRRRIPRHKISIQLYTLRTLLENDLEGTLAELASIGYRTVELAGLHGRSPGEFRTLLDQHGLRATSSHVGIDGDISALLDDAHVLGNRYLDVAYAKFDTAEQWRRYADRLNEVGAAARKSGLRFGYHNHGHEFATVDGEQPFTILAERTDPRFVHFELDLYWAVVAGQDPVELIRCHRGRVLQLHVKDRAPGGGMVDPGVGTIDFPAIFDVAHNHGNREYIVEHDNPERPLRTARVGYDYLDHLRF